MRKRGEKRVRVGQAADEIGGEHGVKRAAERRDVERTRVADFKVHALAQLRRAAGRRRNQLARQRALALAAHAVRHRALVAQAARRVNERRAKVNARHALVVLGELKRRAAHRAADVERALAPRTRVLRHLHQPLRTALRKLGHGAQERRVGQHARRLHARVAKVQRQVLLHLLLRLVLVVALGRRHVGVVARARRRCLAAAARTATVLLGGHQRFAERRRRVGRRLWVGQLDGAKAGVLKKVLAKVVARKRTRQVVARHERAAENQIVLAVDARQRKVLIKRMDFEPVQSLYSLAAVLIHIAKSVVKAGL